MMRPRAGLIAGVGLLIVAASASTAAAEDNEAVRPKINLFYRWLEDWSALADPRARTEPLDSLKYIPLPFDDPKSYVSLGLTVRERFELNDAPLFGIAGDKSNSYLLDRLQWHVDVRPTAHWQIFAEFEDVRAPAKAVITPVDENPLDLRLAFIAYVDSFGSGTLKARVGRQEMAFDLQRFVSVRDGPNVRQAYDAAWLDWEQREWRFIGFWSMPVQYRNEHFFDDFSSEHFQYGGVRAERKNVGPGDLAAYYSRFILDKTRFLDAGGDERRNNFDIRYFGVGSGFDWDLEAMGQVGDIGGKSIRAWGVGSRSGYTIADLPWTPRLGLQIDAASGDHQAGDKTLGTFNPLFPNGYYFTLAGYTGYVNLIHLKPSLTVKPISSLTLMVAAAMQWRETTTDAVYVQPNRPVPGTAGKAGRWSGMYWQFRADWAITPNLAAAVEAVRFQIGDVLRRAGGHDSTYFNVELKYGF
jgi:Alginate export